MLCKKKKNAKRRLVLGEISEVAVFILRPEVQNPGVLLQHPLAQVVHQHNYGEGMFSGRIHHRSVANSSLSKSLPEREVVPSEELLLVRLDS